MSFNFAYNFIMKMFYYNFTNYELKIQPNKQIISKFFKGIKTKSKIKLDHGLIMTPHPWSLLVPV